jgi:DNA (cytosine-5)-methyltransferase 1
MVKGFRSGDTKSKTPKVSAVDLFCGAGGLTHGLIKAGIDVRLGVDIDPYCEYPFTANNNARFLLKSVEEVSPQELKTYLGPKDIKLLAGCAPCQTFSTYNQKATDSDQRWWLLLHFMRLVEKVNPDLVTMENVPRLTKQNVFRTFVRKLERLGYSVSYQVVNCVDYGVPQHRNRLVLLASKLGSIDLISPAEFGGREKTVKQAIGTLPPLKAGKSHPKDRLHQSAMLSEVNMRRMRASKPGGSWRDWPRELIADCHKRSSGKSYPSVYGRMCWDEPAPTITTQFFGFGNGRFGHPRQNRAISLREGAMLQSFPRHYKFVRRGETVLTDTVGRLIGNAVPVTLGEVIGRSIISHVRSANVEPTTKKRTGCQA